MNSKPANKIGFNLEIGDTVLDIPLDKVTRTWKEGLFIKKVCFTEKTSDGEQTYKFGVFNTKGWVKSIEQTIEQKESQ